MSTLNKSYMKRETWFANDFEDEAPKDGDGNSEEDAARDSEEHPSFQNCIFQREKGIFK